MSLLDDPNKDQLPFWHMKRQKGYKVHRFLMIAQIVLALLLAAMIWWGGRTVL